MNKIVIPVPRILSPIRSMIFVFVLGPLALSILYFYSLAHQLPGFKERGLFQFYSATIGDFFVLPTAWFFMSRYYQKVQLENIDLKQHPALYFLAFFLGIISTIIVTLAGIYGPNRDWTLPSMGRINTSGIYHSLFMALVLGTFWSFNFDHWKMVTLNKQEGIFNVLVSVSAIYWKILNLLTLFFILLWADNIYSTEKTQTAFFLSNMTQQIGWLAFLLVNMWVSIRNNLVPKDKPLKWMLRQILIMFALVLLGVILAGLGSVL